MLRNLSTVSLDYQEEKKVYCSQEMREARTGGLEWTLHQVEFGW